MLEQITGKAAACMMLWIHGVCKLPVIASAQKHVCLKFFKHTLFVQCMPPNTGGKSHETSVIRPAPGSLKALCDRI